MSALNSLWVRLTLVFTLVILVVVAVVAFLINRTTATEFQRYITRGEVTAYGMDQLAAYYERQGSWSGVESLLKNGVVVSGSRWPDPRRPGLPEFRLPVVLADASGRVVFDGTGASPGKRLSSQELSDAIHITDSGSEETLGYLLIAAPGAPSLGSTEQRFLDRTRRILILAAVLAVALGLAMGALMSRSLTSPLQRLAAAARAVARGELGKQVTVEGTTEVADVSRAFNEMTVALEKGEQLRKNMVSDVAHELRTPLTVLQGNLRAILDDVYPMDKGEIARLYDETRLLSRLVDDLRELAQAEAGHTRFNMQPIDIANVLEACSAKFEPAAESKSVQLSCGIPDNLPLVIADPDRISQIMNNLMTNALRHTPEGGSISVSAIAGDGVIEITVADTGEGLSKDDLPHIFDRFWRVERSRSRAGGGSGLGLSIARAMVEAQGGQIRAESDGLGKGSAFRFTLPIA
jgi:two-component system OmpR family sensor kinase/two-component system sensor histidine kinase BaeS